jgi:hypothetical protein
LVGTETLIIGTRGVGLAIGVGVRLAVAVNDGASVSVGGGIDEAVGEGPGEGGIANCVPLTAASIVSA